MTLRKKTRRENISLPIGLLRQVDRVLEQSELYTSRARFIEEATKRHLYEIYGMKIATYGIKSEKKRASGKE